MGYKMVGRRQLDSGSTGPGLNGPAGPARNPPPGSRRKVPELRAPSESYVLVGRRAREPEVEPARAARAGCQPEWTYDRPLALAETRPRSRPRTVVALARVPGQSRGAAGPTQPTRRPGRWRMRPARAGLTRPVVRTMGSERSCCGRTAKRPAERASPSRCGPGPDSNAHETH